MQCVFRVWQLDMLRDSPGEGGCARKRVRNIHNEKNIAGIPGTPALFPSPCPSVLLPCFVGSSVCKNMAVVVGLWWCDGVENKCQKRKSAFVDA